MKTKYNCGIAIICMFLFTGFFYCQSQPQNQNDFMNRYQKAVKYFNELEYGEALRLFWQLIYPDNSLAKQLGKSEAILGYMKSSYYNWAVKELKAANPETAKKMLTDLADFAPDDSQGKELMEFCKKYSNKAIDNNYRYYVQGLSYRLFKEDFSDTFQEDKTSANSSKNSSSSQEGNRTYLPTSEAPMSITNSEYLGEWEAERNPFCYGKLIGKIVIQKNKLIFPNEVISFSILKRSKCHINWDDGSREYNENREVYILKLEGNYKACGLNQYMVLGPVFPKHLWVYSFERQEDILRQLAFDNYGSCGWWIR